MTNTYKLINPYIEGSLNTTVKAKNSLDAGKQFYKSLSENFNNNIPEFYFTIQKGVSGKGKYYNFKVKETRNGDDVETEYKIVNIKNQEEKMRNLVNKRENTRQSGGAKKKKSKGTKRKQSKNSSKKGKKKLVDNYDTEDILDEMDNYSDFDDAQMESIYVTNYDNVINYWWYDPYIYDLQTLYIPTFYSYVTPYIEINL